MPQSQEEELPSPDWVYDMESNVHIAKDRYWFTPDYVSFSTHFFPNPFNQTKPMTAIGIGNVEIPVRRNAGKKGGAHKHDILRIEDVLHVPHADCNVLGGRSLDGYELFLRGAKQRPYLRRPGTSAATAHLERRSLVTRGGGFIESRSLLALRLSAPPRGPKCAGSIFGFKDGGSYLIHANWPQEERDKWEEFQVRRKPYSRHEKLWIKKNFRSEFHLLQMYGLKIYIQEDRERGRCATRTMMKKEQEEREGD